jgi:lipopolysaccharide transport system ATP-binding protein
VSAGFALRLLVDSPARLDGVELSVRIERQDGQRVLTTTASDSLPAFTIEAGRWEHRVRIPGMFLAPGTYFATVGLPRPNIQVVGLYEQVLRFVVAETGSGMWKYHGTDYGVVLLSAEWSSRRAGAASGRRSGTEGEAPMGGRRAGQVGGGES